MEVTQLIQIFIQYRRVFFGIWLAVMLASGLWFVAQPIRYQAVLLLNIGRSTNTNVAPEYTYDNFYRLQADERFGDTVVRWLQNPRVAGDILEEAGVSSGVFSEKQLSRTFVAQRLSSQVVEVRFSATEPSVLKSYALAIETVTNKYTTTLNGSQENWFRIIGGDPVIRDARLARWPFFGVAGVAGLVGAFWGTLLWNFAIEQKKRLTKKTSA